LRAVLFKQLEVFLLQTGDRLASLVGDHRPHLYEIRL
jgi:hypothetical protein